MAKCIIYKNMIFNMYCWIISRVVYNCNKTEYFACNVGARQWSNWSHFLFALYLNDFYRIEITKKKMAKNLEDELDIYLRLFILLDADDTVLFFDSAENLQVHLNNFNKYCNGDMWKLK